MNILFLNTRETDYCQDILFSGLRKRTDINLYHFPFNPRYYFPLKNYPRNLGYNFNGFFKSYFQEIPWSNLDTIVVGACKPNILRTYLDLIPKIKTHTKLVFVDGGDWEEIGGDFFRLHGADVYEEFLRKRKFDLVFKREKIKGKEYPENTIPFPFGFNLQRIPKNITRKKKYDVSFWAVESHPIRTNALSLLENKFDCQENGTVLNQKFSKYKRKGIHYLNELAACKIVLNFRGAGWDTLRYWETPAVGSFLISQEPQIEIPHNFRDGSEVVFCKDDLSDLVDLCTYYLKHEDEREQIARNGFEWLRKFHSEDARADYFLKHIEGL